MSRTHYAWATLDCLVYVEDYEMTDALREKFPDKWDEERGEWKEFPSEEAYHEVFRDLASEKIKEHFPFDDPLKLKDWGFDMSSYRHN